jgi:hypothetical protein
MITIYHLKLFLLGVYCTLSVATLILAGFAIYWCITIFRNDKCDKKHEEEIKERKKKLIRKIQRFQDPGQK